ncbi:HU family DNA-binding protein [uncultured Lactobacillus sp.]|uniref:HU family DNA-binding protein n=1 Tax=uncultured Lactobacillus sp. TaxID=153152 RepID=UPI0026068754|nr:HU family DNA-binding protein [uncultured Lactobacillus sp.]
MSEKVSEKVTYTDLIKDVAHLSGCKTTDVKKIIDLYSKLVRDNLVLGRRVTITRLGSFESRPVNTEWYEKSELIKGHLKKQKYWTIRFRPSTWLKKKTTEIANKLQS